MRRGRAESKGTVGTVVTSGDEEGRHDSSTLIPSLFSGIAAAVNSAKRKDAELEA